MPELPEVETVRRGLEQQTSGFKVAKVAVHRHRAIASPPDPEAFRWALTGCSLGTWSRRGKYLYAALQREGAAAGHWGVHLRMTGQFLWIGAETAHPAPPPCSHTRVQFWSEQGQELRFIDTRSFGQMWWVPPGEPLESVMTGLKRLGPEPFSGEFNPSYLQQKLKGSSRPIKNALLDQALVAGIGNIYADEALFLSGLRPLTPSDRVGSQRLQQLHGAIQAVLTTSIESGGTTFSDYRDIYGVNGNYGGVAWVYDREGLPCRVCSIPIQRLKLAGRSAHYCPQCQR